MGFTLEVINLWLGIILIRLCSGFPIGLENSAADFHTQFITGLVGVLLIVCGTVFLIGCLCCQRRNGFKEFQNCPVVASSTSSLDHGHINPIANGEFTIFTPLSPPHHNNNVFLANEQIVGRTEIDCNNENVDVRSWFDGSEGDFPRTKLKYIKEIGRGWFGRVVEGAAQGLDEGSDWSPVAVRILEACATSTERAVFLHDANIYRCGKHPHILKLLGRCLESVPLLLLQELCPCGDLKKYLLDNQSSAAKMLNSDLPLLWSCQISSAMKHLHDHRLTHPDLAARNCQVVNERTIKLGDYGIAATLYPADYYQGAPAVPVRWCAPESIVYTSTTIQPKKVTLQSNVWSFGVTMWEIFEYGAQPYAQLSDDDVISQVVGSGSVRLEKPTVPILYADYLFRLMQMCWSPLASRPSISQVHLMLSDLTQVYQNTKVTNTEPLILLQDFDKRWDSFKPNSVTRTDNQGFLQDSKSLADIDLSDITVLNMNMGKDEDFLNSKPMSPSLNNLHGSLDNLVNDEMDSWLQKVAHKTGDMSYVRGLSEAISDLDKALALENVSSSDSSYQPSPAPETVFSTSNKLQFQLGPTRIESSQPQQSSLTESVQRTSSESETEDENWRRKIEQGAYSEKVHQKSKSVTDLMVLTHIDYSESDSETPLPSLDYRVNYKNVRYAPKHNLENVSLMFGSEGNLLSVHDKFQEELRRLQEERKDSLLFVPEYNLSRDIDTNKTYEDNVVDNDNLLYRTEHSSSNTQSNSYFTNTEQSPNAILQNTNHRNPELLIEELSNNTIDIQPANQVYNVFNLTVDTTFTPNHITKDLKNLILLEEHMTQTANYVPKLSEIIQNNDELMDYIINKYETEEDLNNSKEFNNNNNNRDILLKPATSRFLEKERENCDTTPPQANFDVSLNQDQVLPNNMTHMAAFTSTPFSKREVISNHSSQFSSNFDIDADQSELHYSLETWDNFLGEAMKGPRKVIDFNGFSAEPTSLMFVEGQQVCGDDGKDESEEIDFNCLGANEKADCSDELNCTIQLDEVTNNGTFTVEKCNNETYSLESGNDEQSPNQTYDLNFSFTADGIDKGTPSTSGQGWYLHPQGNAAVTGEMEVCQTGDAESYVGFSVDDEIVAALRNELLMKLPQAQGHVNEQVRDEDDEECEERNEVIIKYYNVPLSPIPEESYSEDSRYICNRRNSTDSENEEWSERLEDGNTPVPDTETISMRNNESPVQEPPHRHTPSQDSCCSNDTLFNLEELTCGANENGDTDKKGDVTLRSEKKQETEEYQDKTDNLILDDNHTEVNNVENMCNRIIEDIVYNLMVYENNTEETDKVTISVDNNVTSIVSNDLNVNRQILNNLVHETWDEDNGELNEISVVPKHNQLPDIALFLDCERENYLESSKTNGLLPEKSQAVDIDDIHFIKNGPEYINVDDLNSLKLNVDYVNVNELDKIININNRNDYVNINTEENDTDIYEALTDIRFTGPSDVQMMSTSFSESVDMDEQDWDSGSDTRSSSSGEFIWKNSNEKCNMMDDIDEVSTETSDEDDGDSPEFVPSAWDKYATPTKSALRSPEKTLEKTEIKSKKQKGVWFKKQKYHCVYEYPREPESPIVNSYDLWQPVATSLIDWEVDTSPYIPTLDASTSCVDLDKHTHNLYLGDFTTGISEFDDEFYISGTAQPFEALAGLASQFFPGQTMSEQWVDLTKSPYENITPDSGVEDITPASNSDINEFTHESMKPQVQSLKTLATSVIKRHESIHLKNNTKDCLGGLRHARNKLKLDLPPSPNAFTITKAFTIEPEAEPITKQEVPTFTTFGKSRFLVQHVDTPTPEEDNHCKNVSFEALPYKSLHIIKGDKAKVEIRGEASLLDSADEDSGIESSTLERRKIML